MSIEIKTTWDSIVVFDDKIEIKLFQHEEQIVIFFQEIDGISEIQKKNFVDSYFRIFYNKSSIRLRLVDVPVEIENVKSAIALIKDRCNLNRKDGVDYISDYVLEGQTADQIANGIFEKLQDGKLFINPNCSESVKCMSLLKKSGVLDRLKALSIMKCDEYAEKQGFKDYSVTNVTGSTKPEIFLGDNYYMFSEDGSLRLAPIPLKIINIYYKDPKDKLFKDKLFGIDKFYLDIYENNFMCEELVIFDYNKMNSSSVCEIVSNTISDFEITGTQVSLTSSSTAENSPKLLNTMFSEFLFGSSYTLLRGLSKNMINISSRIEDLRNIQIVFTDKTDLRLNGISFYYDIKRYLGKSKNREFVNSNSVQDQENDTRKEASNDLKFAVEQLKHMKELLDLGIVTQEEFDRKKKELLGL